jgi:membrane protein
MAVRDLVDRVTATRPYRAWQRYRDANGKLLAAGVGYFAFFSIFPALTLAFTAFAFFLQGRPDILEAIAESLNETLPGMVKTADNPDGLIGISAPETSTLTIAGIVSFVTLLWAGLGWVGALRRGIRGVFGLDAAPGNAVLARVRDLGVLLTLGLGIAVSAIVTSAVGGWAERIAGSIEVLPGNPVLFTATGLLLGVLFDALLMVILIRVLSGAPLPWANVRTGAIVGAVLLTAMKYFGGLLVERATSNPLLGTVAVAAGLLVWLNLMARVVLFSSALAANDLDVTRLAGAEEPSVKMSPLSVTPYAAHVVTEAPPSRAGDRVSFAAGAVLGALGALTLGAWRGRRR